MAESYLQQRIYPYDGGQDSTKNPILIKPEDVVYSDNIVYTTYSTKKKKPGTSYLYDDIQTVQRRILGMYDFWRLGQQRHIVWDGQRLKAIHTLNETIDDITSDFELPTDEAITFAPFQGVLIMFFQNSNTVPKYWTQTGPIHNLSASAPLAPFGRVWLNRLICPDPSVPGRLLFSKTNDPTDFVGGDAFALDLDVNDGDPDGITAIFPPFFGNLYVTKRLSTYKVSPVQFDTSVVFTYSKISDGVGCISHNAVVATEKNIFFPSDWGWHQFESSDKISEIDTSLLSTDIQPIWRDGVNFKRAKYMQATYDRELNSILCSFPADSFNYPTDVWGFSLITKKWYRWSNYNHTAMCRYVDSSNKRLVTAVGSSTGQLGFIDSKVRKDYDKPISIYFKSGIVAPSGQPDEEYEFKYITPVYVPQSGGSFTITMKIDGETTNKETFNMQDTSLGDELGEDFVMGESVLGGMPTVALDKVRIGGNGMFYQLIISHQDDTDDGVDFEMLGVIIDLEPINKGTGKRVA